MRTRSRLAALIFFLLLALANVQSVVADGAAPLYSIRQRFGVNVAASFPSQVGFPGSIADYPNVAQVGFGWYSDWRIDNAPLCPDGIEYAQLLQTRPWPPNWTRLEESVRCNPGSLWLIGNEPETRGQGEHTPSEYAERYHEAYHFIKGIDPETQIAIGGLVMPTPLRLEWLDQCLAHYEQAFGEPMPVDVWNIHVQILQEKRGSWGCGIPYGMDDDEGRLYEIIDNCNVTVFKQLIIEFCMWLDERGQRDKPLIISEFGVLMPSSYLPQGDQSVLDFMEGAFDYLLSARDPVLGYAADEGRLVQRWMWFSLNFPFYERTPGGFNGGLFVWQNPDQYTVFGEFYEDYVESVTPRTIDIPVNVDTYIDAARPTRAYSDRGRIKVKADSGGYVMSGLFGFDLSDFSQGADVLTATLTMHAVARTNAQSIQMRVGPATTAWDQDVTYQEATLSGLERGQPSVLVEVSEENEPAHCDVTDVVRAWTSGELPNHGLMIDTLDAGNRGNVTYDFASSEWVEGPQPPPELSIRCVTHTP